MVAGAQLVREEAENLPRLRALIPNFKKVPVCQLRVRADAANPNADLIEQFDRLAKYYKTT